MALEAVAAIGLASSILQFIDFGSKIVSGSRDIYRSADGATESNLELEAVISDLSKLSLDVEDNFNSVVSSNPSRHALSVQSLNSLAVRCRALSDELLGILARLKINCKQKKLASLLQGLKSVWKEPELDLYKSRLAELRSEMLIRLVSILYEQSNASSKLLKDVCKHYQDGKQQRIAEIRSFKDELASLSQVVERNTNMADLKDIVVQLTHLKSKFSDWQSERSVLDSLYHEDLKSRRTNIFEPHRHTFEWIFDDHSPEQRRPPCFVKWLESSEGIYWITGKAGSGKSTLMKFICDHDKTIQALRKWSGDRPIHIASHFFWASGNSLQRSQRGLLQSLLYEILCQYPSLISLVMSSAGLRKTRLENHSWTVKELTHGLKSIGEQLEGSDFFCFFIDGLDEYEGDHEDFVQTLKDLASSSNVKLCLASRPWNIFETSFGGHPEQRIMIHNYTEDDIKLFASERLSESPRFRELSKIDPQCEFLLREIVHAAEGVFLWVYLVLRSLRSGLTNYDNVSDLKKRLLLLPNDLESYFKLLLESVDETYRPDTAKILLICVHAVDPPNLLTLFYFDEPAENFGIHQEIKDLNIVEKYPKLEEAYKRLKSRCTDLIVDNRDDESSPGTRYSVVHRTAKDFLKTKDVQRLLFSWISQPFCVPLFLANSFLAQIKELHTFAWSGNGLFYCLNAILFYASQMESSLNCSTVQLLEELETTLNVQYKHRRVNNPSKHDDDKDELIFGELEHLTESNPGRLDSLAIYWGLQGFLDQKYPDGWRVNDELKIYERRMLPLEIVTSYRVWDQFYDWHLLTFEKMHRPMVSMVRRLFKLGADPNQSIDVRSQVTIWTSVLGNFREHSSWKSLTWRQPHKFKPYVEILELFVENKANLYASIFITPENSTPALTILRHMCKRYGLVSLEENISRRLEMEKLDEDLLAV